MRTLNRSVETIKTAVFRKFCSAFDYFFLQSFQLLAIGILFTVSSCYSNRELRGEVRKSKDKITYLMIKEKEYSDCEIYVDGMLWPYPIGEHGKIIPGDHKITCGSPGNGLTIHIQEGTTFIFDYWGP